MPNILLGLAGLAGACGVALAAAGSHLSSDLLQTAGGVVMAHAPALLALATRKRGNPSLLTLGGLVLASGLAFFAGDLTMRALSGHALFALAAPLGGTLLILGWICIAAAGLLKRDD